MDWKIEAHCTDWKRVVAPEGNRQRRTTDPFETSDPNWPKPESRNQRPCHNTSPTSPGETTRESRENTALPSSTDKILTPRGRRSTCDTGDRTRTSKSRGRAEIGEHRDQPTTNGSEAAGRTRAATRNEIQTLAGRQHFTYYFHIFFPFSLEEKDSIRNGLEPRR